MTMTQEQSSIPNLIEERIRQQVKPIAAKAVRALEELIIAELGKIGVHHMCAGMYSFLDKVASSYTENLAEDRINAMVNDLVKPPAAEPVESVTLQAARSWGPKPTIERPAEVAEVKSLTVSSGDTVVVKLNSIVDREACEKLKAWARQSLPEGVKVLVLDKGVTLEVLKRGDA